MSAIFQHKITFLLFIYLEMCRHYAAFGTTLRRQLLRCWVLLVKGDTGVRPAGVKCILLPFPWIDCVCELLWTLPSLHSFRTYLSWLSVVHPLFKAFCWNWCLHDFSSFSFVPFFNLVPLLFPFFPPLPSLLCVPMASPLSQLSSRSKILGYKISRTWDVADPDLWLVNPCPHSVR